jgi:NADP-dependent aldehyde dehydrogenase
VVLGPNNFPFAFNSVAGGDFAAAIAAGNPVIGKANSSHPGTTRIFAEQALAAAQATGMPPAIVQLLYRLDHADGNRLIADRRVGAVGFTGSRDAGLKLKSVADAVGKPIYLELSSINPVVVLPGALNERVAQIVDEFTTSCLMGTGQFCTNPGLVLLLAGGKTDEFIAAIAAKFDAAPAGTLLSAGVNQSLDASIEVLQKAGAESVTKNQSRDESRYCHPNTLLRISGRQFLADPETFQTEAFGNSSLLVVSDDLDQLLQVLGHLEGNLTGCVYSDTAGSDDASYARVGPALSKRVGRLLNDKMPTGVAVSSAMNHGGPFPATGHPGFTAVGLPASIHRFAKLQCYDNVRSARLPACLQDKNPGGMWRMIDGSWTQADVGG